jgi:Ala-tRNA(Pro) deacylase
MAIAITLRDFLESHHLPYDTMRHAHTRSPHETAQAAHQPPGQVAKSLLLKDGERYLLAVLPADRRVHFGRLHKLIDRTVGLATENEVGEVFPDCELGAIPPTGLLYDIDTLVDNSLLAQADVYFEAGDHEQLIHMTQKDFRNLLGDATRADFSNRA